MEKLSVNKPKDTQVVTNAVRIIARNILAATDEVEPIVEETVVEDTVAEETVAEETVAEETVAEETVAEETVAEETVVEETVVEETVVEDTVAEETVAEETVAEETAAEETPLEETAAEETAAEETPLEETVVEETNIVGTSEIDSAIVRTYVKIPYSPSNPDTITINIDDKYADTNNIYTDIEKSVYAIVKEYESKRSGDTLYKSLLRFQVPIYLED